MNKLPENFEMDRYGLHVRLVNENDAEFILKLRTDPKLSQYIHSTDKDLEKQKEWIRHYKKREKEGKEYYLIFFRNNKPSGLNRIYNINRDIFTTGSWLFDPHSQFEDSILASIIGREIAFETLNMNLENGFDGVHVDNKKVIKFNKLIGLKETGRVWDIKGEYIAMKLTKEDFLVNKQKLLKYLGY